MKAGVRISPLGVEITPVRACPSVAFKEKENFVITVQMHGMAPNAKPVDRDQQGHPPSPATNRPEIALRHGNSFTLAF
jgi:hypothetical protein